MCVYVCVWGARHTYTHIEPCESENYRHLPLPLLPPLISLCAAVKYGSTRYLDTLPHEVLCCEALFLDLLKKFVDIAFFFVYIMYM